MTPQGPIRTNAEQQQAAIASGALYVGFRCTTGFLWTWYIDETFTSGDLADIWFDRQTRSARVYRAHKGVAEIRNAK